MPLPELINSITAGWDATRQPYLEFPNPDDWTDGDWEAFGRYCLDNNIVYVKSLYLVPPSPAVVNDRIKLIAKLCKNAHLAGQFNDRALLAVYLQTNGMGVII